MIRVTRKAVTRRLVRVALVSVVLATAPTASRAQQAGTQADQDDEPRTPTPLLTDADRAAFVKRNDPFATDIPELVELGFLVRTRADFDTLQSVENDPSQREQAFQSGAQFGSTDYRVPNLDYSDYSVGFEDDAAVRCNIVNAPEGCTLGLPDANLALLQTSCLLPLGWLGRSRKRGLRA